MKLNEPIRAHRKKGRPEAKTDGKLPRYVYLSRQYTVVWSFFEDADGFLITFIIFRISNIA